MFAKQRSNQNQMPPNSLKNVLNCLFVTLLLLFEGHAIRATPVTRLRQQQQQHQQHHQHEHHHQQQHQHQYEEKNSRDCEHKSLVELIKTSPIILKALGAHIFRNSDDDEDVRILQSTDDALLSYWQSEQNEFAAHKETSSSSSSFALPGGGVAALPPSPSSRGSFTFPASMNARNIASHSNQQGQQLSQTRPPATAAASDAILGHSSLNTDALLITLTPDTIYKGASLLKTATNAAISPASNSRSGNSATDNSDAANDGDSFYSSSEASMEGQFNATIQPLSCFDGNLLKMLPTDLIIFGKLMTMEQQQQQQQPKDLINAQHGYTGTSASGSSHQQQPQQQTPLTKDILKISLNGLHRWSPQFESYIWTHLGWDDWSDFTVCSVACGKGVQQRFRRCLLDNPMVNMKMNFNEIEEEEIAAEEEELEVEQEVEEYDDDNDHHINVGNAVGNNDSDTSEVDVDVDEEKQYDDIDRMIFEDDDDDEIIEQLKAIDNYDSEAETDTDSGSDSDTLANPQSESEPDDDTVPLGVTYERFEKTDVLNRKQRREKLHRTAAINQDSIEPQPQTDVFEMDNNMLHFVTASPARVVKPKRRAAKQGNAARMTTEEPEIMRIFEGDFNDVYSERIYKESPFNTPLAEDKKDTKSHRKGQRQRHKRHKSAQIVSTMFCEGYNIEQRTCNSFECSDDINDLLKFYRKYPTTEETNAGSTQALNIDFNTASSSSSSSSSSASTAPQASVSSNLNSGAPSTLTNDLGTWNSLTEAYNQNSNTITPLPTNTGFVQTWHNLLNFSIMLTIRAKNDSNNAASATATATIFSIRNGTHNLYLETYQDGLHLYLERDKTTEMLPIQFNLYDYRWHQVAISIKNGDFITIYVDCSWTNSFVVSKRLFSLPLDADVEIGKGFNGELQQLLILPRLQGRRQCSDKRISINEVKRYIIDTFIGDYGN